MTFESWKLPLTTLSLYAPGLCPDKVSLSPFYVSVRISTDYRLSCLKGKTKSQAITKYSLHMPACDWRGPVSAVREDKDKVVVIMGATGSGKSKLSIDLATLFPSEIINSDKIQVYKGLDTTTNKIPIRDRLGVKHHLLGEFDPDEVGELTHLMYRSIGHSVITDITTRGNVPLVVGGSNSFVYALLADRFDPRVDVFNDSFVFDSVRSKLRYNCCFIWVDVLLPVLNQYLIKRVDEMLDSGMFDELARYYDPNRVDSGRPNGLRKAIGVPEFDRFFKKYRPGIDTWRTDGYDYMRESAYEEAVREIKENTCRLAKRQIGKILRLREGGWDLRRVDATEPFREALMTSDSGGKSARWAEVWRRQVVEPSVEVVKSFLEELKITNRDMEYNG